MAAASVKFQIEEYCLLRQLYEGKVSSTTGMWDSKAHEKRDKNRFRHDMGGVEEAYAKIIKRMKSTLK